MAQPSRTAGLLAARALDSRDKRRRAIDVLGMLEAKDEPISFPAVARAAGVSTWLVYAEGVREHVEAARQRQTTRTEEPPEKPTATGLATDLALARAEIKQLRAERDKLLRRLRLQLGAESEAPARAELITRVADLDAVNRRLIAERDTRATADGILQHRVSELEDDLTAARESLRRMIRSENSGH